MFTTGNRIKCYENHLLRPKCFIWSKLYALGSSLIFSRKEQFLSLIFTHAFRLSPVKFFAWDMRRVVKRIEQDENISFALFVFEVQIFQLLRNFLTAKPIRLLFLVTWTFHEDKKFSQNGRSPQIYQA